MLLFSLASAILHKLADGTVFVCVVVCVCEEARGGLLGVSYSVPGEQS